jgi:hypothetical protein
MTSVDGFRPGQTLFRRYLRGPHATRVQATTVVADDGRGLVLWLPDGADFACRVDADGRPLPAASTIEAYGVASLSKRTWQDSSVLMLHPPDAAHSVRWFFANHTFTGWYVNLESPYRRRHDTVDTVDIVDHHLDIVVQPDRTRRWKDEDEFIASTGRPGYWSLEEAHAIRDEAQRAVAAIEARRFPYCGTWCQFEPEPTWPRPCFPQQGVRLTAAEARDLAIRI